MCDTGVFGCECSMICMWLRWKDEKINGQRVFNSLWPDRTWFATICHLNLPVDLSYLRSQNAFDSVPIKKKKYAFFILFSILLLKPMRKPERIVLSMCVDFCWMETISQLRECFYCCFLFLISSRNLYRIYLWYAGMPELFNTVT